jgi:hypothetical protein
VENTVTRPDVGRYLRPEHADLPSPLGTLVALSALIDAANSSSHLLSHVLSEI